MPGNILLILLLLEFSGPLILNYSQKSSFREILRKIYKFVHN